MSLASLPTLWKGNTNSLEFPFGIVLNYKIFNIFLCALVSLENEILVSVGLTLLNNGCMQL